MGLFAFFPFSKCQFLQILGIFAVFFADFGHFCRFLHQNGPKWHYMTPNDPKTLPMDVLHDYMSYWTTLGPFQRPMKAP